MSQADCELAREREYFRSLDDGDDGSLVLHLGDALVEVFYNDCNGVITIENVDMGAGNYADARCFSQWQLDDWIRSIQRHIKAQEAANDPRA